MKHLPTVSGGMGLLVCTEIEIFLFKQFFIIFRPNFSCILGLPVSLIIFLLHLTQSMSSLARSSILYIVSLACVLFSIVLFPWYIQRRHFPCYVFFFSSLQLFLRDLFRNMAARVVPWMCSFLILSLLVAPQFTASSSSRSSCFFIVADASAPCSFPDHCLLDLPVQLWGHSSVT